MASPGATVFQNSALPKEKTENWHSSVSNNEHFSSSTVNICPRCWYYRGFWHQACPPMARGSGLFRCQSIQTVPSCRARETQLTFFVAASVGRDYGASCGPAARHSTRSHVPCSFSGIEPISPVAVAATADHYHAVKLIEQQSYSRCIPEDSKGMWDSLTNSPVAEAHMKLQFPHLSTPEPHRKKLPSGAQLPV